MLRFDKTICLSLLFKFILSVNSSSSPCVAFIGNIPLLKESRPS